MKRCFITFAFDAWLFARIIVQPALAQLSGGVIYNYIDLSTGTPVVRLASINADGSSDQFVTLPLLNPYYPAWSRDGQLLAVAGNDPARPNKLSTDVYLWQPANGQLARLSAFEDTANASGFITFYPSYLAVSPEGQRVAAGMISYVGARSTIIKTNIFGDPSGPYDVQSKITRCVSLIVVNVAGGDPLLVASGLCDDDNAHPGEGVDWSPTQDLLAYPYNTVTTFSGPSFTQFPITTIQLIEPTAGAADQGRRRQLTFPSGTVGAVFDSVALAWGDDFAPAFSPDGRLVAYVRLYTWVTSDGIKHTSVPSIRIVGVDGSNDREVAQFQQGSYITRLSWSPDAKQLVFDLGQQALRDGFPLRTFDFNTVSIARINTDGTGFGQVRGVPATWPAWWPGTGGIAQPPLPAIASLQPTTVPANSTGFDLTVNGSGFTPDSVILWNGGPLPTSFISANQLHGTVAGSRLGATGQVTVTVSNSGGSATTSNTASFTINPGNPNGGA
ncbi:MAG: IPT/TIG domain-containing protein, partial [Bryobacteraceae bacterium]